MTQGMGDAEQWLADYRSRVGEIQRQAEQTQEQIKSMRASAESSDNSVSVVLAPGGRLEELTLSPRAMELGHKKLAATIKETVQTAHAEAANQTKQALQPLLGDSDAMEFLSEQLETGRQDDSQEPASQPRGGKDDGESGGSIPR